MRISVLKIAVVGMIVLVGVIYLLDISADRSGIPAGSATPLPPVEVRSYEGANLSSITDFFENSIKGPQYINESDYRLTVTGLTNRTLTYTYREVIDRHRHYAKVVTLFCVEGWDVTILWEGVLVKDILADAGINPRASTIVLTAHDGYTTSFPLAYVLDRDIIMAYRINNMTLPSEQGYPFQLVAEDKWGYKWIKWIEKIELSDNPAYRGYWEQRGYSNTGDLTRSFFSD
jgi:DMSO/TMAO reductase YedYZ molybdopterin-dependent catalytic subunit